MSCADNVTIVAPRIGEWIVRRGIASVEPKTGGISQQVVTNESLLRITVSCAMNHVSHCVTILKVVRIRVNTRIALRLR
jgi:hypothetical protein